MYHTEVQLLNDFWDIVPVKIFILYSYKLWNTQTHKTP